MANYSISASQLTEGTSVFIRGKLAFARLASLIEGAALAASDQRKVQSGMSPVGKPHTTATIIEAEVQFADPANPTVEEQFVAERRYVSKKNPDTGANYSIDSKGTNLPIIAIPSDKGDGTFDQDTSGQELAQGLDVTLVLRVYKPKNFANRGLSLDQVIVNEVPRYYNAGGVATGELAARGIVFNAPPRAVQAQSGSGSVSGSAVGNGENPVGTDVEDGLSFPAPVALLRLCRCRLPRRSRQPQCRLPLRRLWLRLRLRLSSRRLRPRLPSRSSPGSRPRMLR